MSKDYMIMDLTLTADFVAVFEKPDGSDDIDRVPLDGLSVVAVQDCHGQTTSSICGVVLQGGDFRIVNHMRGFAGIHRVGEALR